MPRISLWKNTKTKDYYYADNLLKENIYHGGTGVYIHKYVGPVGGGGESTIEDLLFLENRNRKYDDDIYEARATYKPTSSDFDLSQFGIFISNDVISITFHYNDILRKVGRKLMVGDVLELPHLEDPDTLAETDTSTVRFYVVEEGKHSGEGYGNQWWSHLWLVRAKLLPRSQEYASIISAKQLEDLEHRPAYSISGNIVDADGNLIEAICNDSPNSNTSNLQKITDGIIDEAYENVRFDPKQFDIAHIWIYGAPDGSTLACGRVEFQHIPWSGDGIPPNGKPLSGHGDSFPEDAQDGDYFLRTDYEKDRLFMKDGNVWRLVEKDFRKVWTSYNKVLDSFIDNSNVDTMTDGAVVKTKKALSETVKPKINLHEDKEEEIKNDNDGKKK